VDLIVIVMLKFLDFIQESLIIWILFVTSQELEMVTRQVQQHLVVTTKQTRHQNHQALVLVARQNQQRQQPQNDQEDSIFQFSGEWSFIEK
jgi:LmbE family N-acetylglucosaminyl deacetylase